MEHVLFPENPWSTVTCFALCVLFTFQYNLGLRVLRMSLCTSSGIIAFWMCLVCMCNDVSFIHECDLINFHSAWIYKYSENSEPEMGLLRNTRRSSWRVLCSRCCRRWQQLVDSLWCENRLRLLNHDIYLPNLILRTNHAQKFSTLTSRKASIKNAKFI